MSALKPIPDLPNLWLECAAILARRRRPSARIAETYPAGDRFSVAHGPVSAILVPLLLVGLCGDVPLSLVVVALVHPSHPLLIHAVVAATGLMGLGWVMAVKSALCALPHVVSGDALWIGGGVRLSGVVPKAAIKRLLVIPGTRHEWMAEQGVARDQFVLASGYDSPNLAVELWPEAVTSVEMKSSRRPICPRRWVLLYADKPDALSAAVSTDPPRLVEALATPQAV
ncbi:hypothetical protein CH75_19940 [Dyella jiangningensis]|nr:hypothetical protein CH75_19940 [Dyella jiangningensis]